MSNIAAIDGVTGPGRRNRLIGDVTEVTFRLKKKVIEVINKDGSMGQFDLAEVSSVRFTSDDEDYLIAVLAKEDTDDRTRETDPTGTDKASGDRDSESRGDKQSGRIEGKEGESGKAVPGKTHASGTKRT